MNIPKYIINAAREYANKHNGGYEMEDAFIAGYEEARRKDIPVRELTEEEKQLFDVCWKEYGRKGSRKDSFAAWSKLTPEEMQNVLPHIRSYVSTRGAEYKKDFQRYLCHKTFNDVVMAHGGTVVYDPSQMVEKDEYHPLNDGIFQYWDDRNKRLLFNGDISHLNDGYTDDNRPEGATAAWNMYTWKWSREKKEWVKQ